MAFVLDPAHIDVLLSTAIHGPSDRDKDQLWYPPWVGDLVAYQSALDAKSASAVGAALLRQNIESARASSRGHDFHSGPGSTFVPDPRQYEWTDLGPLLTTIEGFRAIETYEDHSRAFFRWCGSGQEALCIRLRVSLSRCLPGYSTAEWHWTADAALARAPRRGDSG